MSQISHTSCTMTRHDSIGSSLHTDGKEGRLKIWISDAALFKVGPHISVGGAEAKYLFLATTFV